MVCPLIDSCKRQQSSTYFNIWCNGIHKACSTYLKSIGELVERKMTPKEWAKEKF